MFEGPVTGNILEVLDNGEVTEGTRVTAGQLALALTPYAQVADLAVNTAASGNNAAAIQSLDDRVTAELASKLDSSALAPAIEPLATAAALATTDGQVAAHGSSIAALQSSRWWASTPLTSRRHAAGGGHQDSKCPVGLATEAFVAVQLASRDASISALQGAKADTTLLASYATNAALSASETTLQGALNAILAELAALAAFRRRNC